MKRAVKISVSVLVTIFVAMIATVLVNVSIKTLVKQQLDQNIAAADSLCISYGEIQISVFTGQAWIKDVFYRSDTVQWEVAEGTVVEGKVDVISLDGINYYNWLKHRQLNLRGFTVVNPHFRMRFYHNSEKDKGAALQVQVQEQREKRLEKMLGVARIFVDDATLDRLTVERGSISANAINDSLRVSISEFTFSIYDLGYNIKDLVPHYNDSIFHFLIRNVDVHIPKVPMSLTVNELMASPNGVLEIKDVWTKSYFNPGLTESVVAGADRILVGGFDVAKFNKEKEMDIHNIHLYNPNVQLKIEESEEAVKSRGQQTQINKISAVNQKAFESNLDVVTDYIVGLTVDTILLHDASMNVQSVSTCFRVLAERLEMAVYGVGYSLIDDIPYHYNDSIFQFYLGSAHILTPDSTVAISTSNVRYDNGGSFSLGKTHVHHVIDRWKLAHLMGDVPATLIDLRLDSLYTSSKNVVKEAKTLTKSFYLDTVFVDIRKMSIFRDARYKAKQPYMLPQTYMLQVEYPFVINYAHARVRDMHIETALTKKNIGKLDLGPLDMHVHNITPIPNSVMAVTGRGKMGQANVHLDFNLKVNQACNWNAQVDAVNVDAHHLDSMVYPLVGLTIGCDIHRLHAEYGGNLSLASGTFCMEYDNVDIFADKHSTSPIKAVRGLSGLINSAGRTIVNKSNPSKPGQQPVAYNVTWKNNPKEDPSLFYLGPLIDGCVKTMLPGLFLSKRVKTNQSSPKSKRQ